jgi:iron complex outermembrane receptor protein
MKIKLFLPAKPWWFVLLVMVVGLTGYTPQVIGQTTPGLPTDANPNECNLTITGQVFHADTKTPLPFANVLIKGSTKGAVSDENGHYHIDNLCEGHYVLICSQVGCDHAEHAVEVKTNTVENFYLEEISYELSRVTVLEKAIELETTQASQELTGAELANRQGLSLGAALSELPGVTTLSTGATITKPMIQGMHSNRILILNNEAPLESQQWGSEHAPEIDPFLATNVKVVKGAAGVRYGAGAIGGAILVEPDPLSEISGWKGELNLVGYSNGRTGIASGIVEGRAGKKLPISGRLQGTLKRGGNLRTPGYFLDNSGVAERNFSWSLGTGRGAWKTEVFYANFFTRIGILSAAHIGNLTDLRNAIERGRPLEDGDFTYEIDRPLQRVLHETLKWKSSVETGELGILNLQYVRQFNRRQEFDAHRPYGALPETLDDPDIEFEITTHAADAYWEHNPVANLRGTIGVNYTYQNNTTDRGALIPNYHSHGGSVYWIERWKNYPAPLEVEAGVRYDYRFLSAGSQGGNAIDRDFTFQSVSGTLGAIYRFPELAQLSFNVGTAWRPPHISELFSDGVHHGSASYERGRTDLTPERALNTSLSVELNRAGRWKGYLNLYYNRIRDFIFLEPMAEPMLTIRGAFPAFQYEQADSRTMGLDARVGYELTPGLSLQTGASLIRGRNLELDDHLIFMPADRFRHTLRYAWGDGSNESERHSFVSVHLLQTLKQTRAPVTDFAPPPDGYLRLDLEATHRLTVGKQPVEVGLQVYNLFNVSYQEYLNRLRYFAVEPGRNVSLRLKVPFTW